MENTFINKKELYFLSRMNLLFVKVFVGVFLSDSPSGFLLEVF